jgi:mannitol/fructose-specific phosphotransferase system IIA component (Ntr-type)
METYLRKRFGTIAVEKGLITDTQLIEAIQIQTKENVTDGTHRLLGQILSDQGLLTENQIEEILMLMSQQMTYMISMGR